MKSALESEVFMSLKVEFKKIFEELEDKFDLGESEDTIESEDFTTQTEIAQHISENQKSNEAVNTTEEITKKNSKEMAIQFETSDNQPEVKVVEGPCCLLAEKKKRFSQKRAQTLAFIDVSDVEQNRPENLCASTMANGYVDVTGFDLVEPKFKGMTPDQWREHKRAQAEAENELGLDMEY